MNERPDCYYCNQEIKGRSQWMDTFYGNPRYIGPYCEDCVEKGQDGW